MGTTTPPGHQHACGTATSITPCPDEGESETQLQASALAETRAAKQELTRAVARFNRDITGIASTLAGSMQTSLDAAARLTGEVERLRRQNAALQAGTRRFAVFGRLPPELRALVWRAAAVEAAAPNVFSVDLVRLAPAGRNPGFSVRYPRQTVAQACREARAVLYPRTSRPGRHRPSVPSAIDEEAAKWGWEALAWHWFDAHRDTVYFSRRMIQSPYATAPDALRALETLVGPLKHILVSWEQDMDGEDLLLGPEIFSKFGCLAGLRSIGFVLAHRRLKRHVRSEMPALPVAIDIDDTAAVTGILAQLGEDASFLRRDLTYFRERGFVETGDSGEYWEVFKSCLQEDWLLKQRERNPPPADSDPFDIDDDEIHDWAHPWVQEHLAHIPVFKRVIMFE